MKSLSESGGWLQQSWQETAERIVAALGHLVIYSPGPLKIGTVIPQIATPACTEPTTDQPFVVVDEAAEADWIRQMEFVGCSTSYPPTWRFYFVETD